ncbi:MAG: ATP-dependent Clp protease ATP-binding subunit [Oscillospiraceae bacterium]
MTFQSFTEKANNCVNNSINIAIQLGHTYVGSEHLFAAILKESNSLGQEILNQNKVLYKDFEDKLVIHIGKGMRTKLNHNSFTPRLKQILESSILLSRKLSCQSVGTEHLLLSCLSHHNSITLKILKENKVNINDLLRDCQTSYYSPNINRDAKINQPLNNDKSLSNLIKRFSVDLTEKAKSTSIDPVISRDDEITRLIQILSRRRKNNPCLVGEPGVGKTAIVEGLALMITKGEVPQSIKNKKIITLDLTSMVAGAKYRGDFEDRLKNVLNEISANRDIILFIDEIHSIIGAGGAEGAIDASNILKPYLARGEIQLISATTNKEYVRHIEKDSALERRFQPIQVNEPSIEDTVKIFMGIKSQYETYHNILITEDIIRLSVSLADRYITDRYFPDKAIDLIDEACSKRKLEQISTSPTIDLINQKLLELETKKIDALNMSDLYKVGNIQGLEHYKKTKLNNENDQNTLQNTYLTKDDIYNVISSLTKIPKENINYETNTNITDIENQLKTNIIGQYDAIKSVSKAIKRSKIGLNDKNKPLGSFLFLGPTGVGKTQLAKELSTIIFNTEKALIRFDMSEYMEKHSISKLIGSPPGYVGYDDAGQLTQQVRTNPYSIVLLDEIEKAHPSILNILLQILDDGILTDAKGKKVNFKNTIVIMTSNIGSKEIINCNKKMLGFYGNIENSYGDISKNVNDQLKKQLSPELINRISDIIIFKKLTDENIYKITENLLNQLNEKLISLGFLVNFTENTIKEISKIGFDQNYGARPIKRAITSNIEDLICDLIISNTLEKNTNAILDFNNGKFTLISNKKEELIKT